MPPLIESCPRSFLCPALLRLHRDFAMQRKTHEGGAPEISLRMLRRLFFCLVWCATLLASTYAQAGHPTKGPLRVDASNPRYFADNTGKPVYLAGVHTWNALYDANKPLDYEAFLAFLEQHNYNFTKFRAWDSALLYNPLYYKRTGPGKAADGLPKLDLHQFNQAYFDRMRKRIKEARARGIYVLIMLFDTEEANGDPRFSRPDETSWAHPARSRWLFHPYNKLNNINGIDGGNRDNSAPAGTETLRHPEITALREAYIRKVVDTVNDLDNVLFEIANETHNGDPNATDVSQYPTPQSPYGPLAPFEPAWENHMSDYIHSYERTKPYQHPVVMTSPLWAPSNDSLYASSAEAIGPGGDVYQENPPAADGRKVVLTDPDHFGWVDWRGTRAWVWKSFVRGLNVIPLDSLPTSISGNDGGGWGGGDMADVEETRKALTQTRWYATRIDLATMTPRNDLASTTFCLAAPGDEYLVYQPADGQFTMKLVAGAYRYEWFDPGAGTVSGTGEVTSTGGESVFTSPFRGDAVLYLKRTRAEAR
jgi:hypothetical protein